MQKVVNVTVGVPLRSCRGTSTLNSKWRWIFGAKLSPFTFPPSFEPRFSPRPAPPLVTILIELPSFRAFSVNHYQTLHTHVKCHNLVAKKCRPNWQVETVSSLCTSTMHFVQEIRPKLLLLGNSYLNFQFPCLTGYEANVFSSQNDWNICQTQDFLLGTN